MILQDHPKMSACKRLKYIWEKSKNILYLKGIFEFSPFLFRFWGESGGSNMNNGTGHCPVFYRNFCLIAVFGRNFSFVKQEWTIHDPSDTTREVWLVPFDGWRCSILLLTGMDEIEFFARVKFYNYESFLFLVNIYAIVI